ncbi:hypothetical protein Acr_00g0055560 [Actinidia rufa]|uniref:Uncharacterized protein n=1 Tax=Actinidia rufa TaxID=165716 RepID=A0A7J0DM79_9ERIC|nr:hypothetical protein Acr_00g0055560 [Actinidia rufa]
MDGAEAEGLGGGPHEGEEGVGEEEEEGDGEGEECVGAEEREGVSVEEREDGARVDRREEAVGCGGTGGAEGVERGLGGGFLHFWATWVLVWFQARFSVLILIGP